MTNRKATQPIGYCLSGQSCWLHKHKVNTQSLPHMCAAVHQAQPHARHQSLRSTSVSQGSAAAQRLDQPPGLNSPSAWLHATVTLRPTSFNLHLFHWLMCSVFSVFASQIIRPFGGRSQVHQSGIQHVLVQLHHEVRNACPLGWAQD